MKKKNASHCKITLEYLFEISQKLSGALGRKKCKELVETAHKYQIRLKKIKQLICKICYNVLTPKITCTAALETRECGFGLSVTCNNCSNNTFIVQRKKRGST
ncbi:hypothetical protein GINT2_001387 [Glugoides intestinalis]